MERQSPAVPRVGMITVPGLECMVLVVLRGAANAAAIVLWL